jgi:hypothetical protein
MGGIITSSTSDETILPNAAPMITPTAKSTTLPRMANSLNPFSTAFLLCFSMKVNGGPAQETLGRTVSSADYIQERTIRGGIAEFKRR